MATSRLPTGSSAGKVPGFATRRYHLPSRYIPNRCGASGAGESVGDTSNFSLTFAMNSSGVSPFRSLTTRW